MYGDARTTEHKIDKVGVVCRHQVYNVANCRLVMNSYGQTVVTPGNSKSYKHVCMKIDKYTNVSVTRCPFHLSAAQPTL